MIELWPCNDFIFKDFSGYFSYTTDGIWITCYRIDWYFKYLCIFNRLFGQMNFGWLMALEWRRDFLCGILQKYNVQHHQLAGKSSLTSHYIKHLNIHTVKLYFQQTVQSPLNITASLAALLHQASYENTDHACIEEESVSYWYNLAYFWGISYRTNTSN